MTTPLQRTSLGELGYTPLLATSLGELGASGVNVVQLLTSNVPVSVFGTAVSGVSPGIGSASIIRVRPIVPVFNANPRVHLRQLATRINAMMMGDGSGQMQAPLILATFTVATLPDPSLWTDSVIHVSDEVGGPTTAFSDGTNWLRQSDLAIVS